MALKVTYVDGITARLTQVVSDLDDTSTLMRRIAGDLESAVEDNFDGEVDPDGVPFAPLSERYKKARFARGYTGPILQRTGIGVGSFVSKFTRTSAVVGTNIDYMEYHHYGTRKMPARRVLGFGRKLRNTISVRISDYLSGRRK